MYRESKKAPAKIKLNKKSVRLKRGKTYQIKPILATKSQSYKITYSSERRAVATVTGKGLVRAKKKGITHITVETYNKKSTRLKVTVI